MIKNCVCNNNKSFTQCCGPFLERVKIARTPQQLMRSRFSAFAIGGYGEYLLETWAPEARNGLSVFDLSLKSVDWRRLNIIDKFQTGDQASVEFKAHFMSDGVEKTHHEISQFHRRSNRWFYVNGDVFEV